jgi:hypothetical protein
MVMPPDHLRPARLYFSEEMHADVTQNALQAQLPQIQVLADKLREAHEQLNVAEFNATEAAIAADARLAALQARALPSMLLHLCAVLDGRLLILVPSCCTTTRLPCVPHTCPFVSPATRALS